MSTVVTIILNDIVTPRDLRMWNGVQHMNVALAIGSGVGAPLDRSKSLEASGIYITFICLSQWLT